MTPGIPNAEPVAYKAIRPLVVEAHGLAGTSGRIDPRFFDAFDVRGLARKIVAELAERRAIAIKEVFESFEFFERTRKRVRAPVMTDVCCGHGLTGLVFAAFERVVKRVVLVDSTRPDNHDPVFEAVCAAAPWVRDKVDYQETRIRTAARDLEPGTSVIGVHACGVRTDKALSLAIQLAAPVAVMPCCYSSQHNQAPAALQDALSVELSSDIARTYRLEAAGYDVSWKAIPEDVTPMNRIVLGVPRSDIDTG